MDQVRARRVMAFAVATLMLLAACNAPAQTGTTPTFVAGTPTPAGVAAQAPTRPVEFIIQTAPGGSSDIYARFWIGVMEKDKMVPTPVQPVNKEGGAGAVAFTYVFEKKGDMHTIMVTLNSFWTTIITQKLPYKSTDFTPIANVALDPFYLWVPADSNIKTAGDFIKEAQARSMIASGTGSKQEDEVLFRRIEDVAKTKAFTYVPQSGGGAVATALAGKQGGVEVTVNNPSEARSLMEAGKVKAICAFTNVNQTPTSGPFKGLPTCASQGLNIQDYFNVRAVVGPPGLSAGQLKFWSQTFNKVALHEDWKKFVADNGLISDYREGEALKQLFTDYQKIHDDVAKKFGWV
jgi:putative tricarboxylic transport membrane protein